MPGAAISGDNYLLQSSVCGWLLVCSRWTGHCSPHHNGRCQELMIITSIILTYIS